MLRFIVNQDVNVWQREIILVPVLCSTVHLKCGGIVALTTEVTNA